MVKKILAHKKKIIAAILLGVGTYLQGGDIGAALEYLKSLLALFGG